MNAWTECFLLSKMPNNKPTISIIIVSWNVRDLLRRCLQSIYDQTKTSFEIFVVDNASSDGSADMVAAEFEDVKLIRNRKNRGFAAANNQAVKLARGDYIIFLNDDTEILDSALDKMAAYLKDNKSTGIAGARLLNADKTIQVGTARTFPSFKVLSTMLLGFHSFLMKKDWLQKYYMLGNDFDKTQSVDQVMGASLMTRRSIIQRLGSFDEKFWIWFEEVDLCKRVKNAGYDIAVIAPAEIIHHKGKSFVQQIKLKKFWHLSKSLLHYSWKHFPPYQPILLALMWPLGALVALAVQITGLKSRQK